jgi:hypothetical protein
MKRMDEVFELPVIAGCYSEDEVDIFDDKHIWQGTINGVVEALSVAHAINHVDALADALETLLDAVLFKRAEDSINNQIIAAAQALSKYRGDK